MYFQTSELRKNRRHRYETKTTYEMLHHRVSNVHRDGMTYTDSLVYVDIQDSLSDTTSDSPDSIPDDPV